MTAISHLTRLRTLSLEAARSVPNFKFRVLPTPLLSPLRQLSVSTSASKELWFSCPALAPGAVVQLSTAEGQLALTAAPAGCLVGCRLEVSAGSVMIAYEGQYSDWMPHVGEPDLMDHLFRWIKNSGTECFVLQPDCDFREAEEEEVFEETDEEWQPSFQLEVDSGGARQSGLLALPPSASLVA